MFKINLWKFFAVLSSVSLTAVSLAPDVFQVPLGIRPWIFLFNIFWFMTVCLGV